MAADFRRRRAAAAGRADVRWADDGSGPRAHKYVVAVVHSIADRAVPDALLPSL